MEQFCSMNHKVCFPAHFRVSFAPRPLRGRLRSYEYLEASGTKTIKCETALAR